MENAIDNGQLIIDNANFMVKCCVNFIFNRDGSLSIIHC